MFREVGRFVRFFILLLQVRFLRKLVSRGLRRVSIVVHDDFSGLAGMTKSFFPRADVQLCTVHMLRNGR